MATPILPDDLLLDLIVRLPVKSLVRFKCVSKSWEALIGSEEFIKLKLNRTIADPKAQKILIEYQPWRVDRREGHKLQVAEFDSYESFTKTVSEIRNPLQGSEGKQGISLVGSCNGLICMQFSAQDLALCNPWTRKLWKLPSTPVELEYKMPPRRSAKFRFAYGFGYDDVSDDYKVVRLVEVYNGRRDLTHGFEAKVYSLKSNLWGRIQHFPYIIGDMSNGVLVNCSLHWKLDCMKNTSLVPTSLLAIDLRTEELRILSPPPDLTVNDWLLSVLGVLNSSLLGVSWKGTKRWCYDVWIMKEYGIKDSWTKLCIEVPYLFRPMPVAYSESGEELILGNSDEILWYNIKNNSVQKVEVAGSGGYIPNVCQIIESLVDPCGGVNDQLESDQEQDILDKETSISACDMTSRHKKKFKVDNA